MRTVVITGADGFIGRNLRAELSTREDMEVLPYDVGQSPEVLDGFLSRADFVFHLAGINRPQNVAEFTTGNTDFTRQVIDTLEKHGRKAPLLLSSSIQAELDNPYGISKHEAENAVFAYGKRNGAKALVYRLQNVFGKWCRPNYNSAVATFCHNIANGLPIQVNDPQYELKLVYIDDVIREFCNALEGKEHILPNGYCTASPVHTIRLQEIADLIHAFHDKRPKLFLPDLSNPLVSALYSTYISYLPKDEVPVELLMRIDPRGWLCELVKTPGSGQVFVSRTRPGITRGNHWHHSKTEKFIVIEGEAVIRLRKIDADEVLEYKVSGEKIQSVDILPGYTHSIQNTGESDMVAIFWASEIFNPDKPDTYAMNV
jgi:UDP-2-acetamido-2,6-beta-L-arabino-hexul-4-ose reductase